MATRGARHIGVGIGRDWCEVYVFLAESENFPRWASGLAGGLTKTERGWVGQGPDGPVRVRFSERNAYGIVDHWVTLEAGAELYMPMRVLANDDGAEVVLTVYRTPGMDRQKFEADAAWVARDLAALKALLEAVA